MGTLLCDSNICRLCGEENSNGTYLYGTEPQQESLQTLINQYLPLKVDDNGKLPRTICPGCYIQVQATVQFFSLLLEGQSRLRDLWKQQVERRKKEARERRRLEEEGVLVGGGEDIVMLVGTEDGGFAEISVDRALFPESHELSLRVEGLERPRRKRGRPPKKKEEEKEKEAEAAVAETQRQEAEEEEEEPEDGTDGRRKRRRRAPQRYLEAVRGKELERILKDEGVIGEEASEEEEVEEVVAANLDPSGIKNNIVIGHLETAEGCDMGQLVTVNKEKSQQRSRRKKVHYVCEVCKKGFIHKGRYLMHRNVHQRVLFICNDCNEQFDEKALLEEHQKSTGHAGEGIMETITEGSNEGATDSSRLSCDLCDRTFLSKQTLEIHIRAVHEGQKPFSCDVCGKHFSYQNSLKAHMVTHAEVLEKGEKQDYSCDLCQKTFSHPSSVTYHKDTEHNDGRRFICNKCGKGFKHKQLLHRHQLVHTDVRPYSCKLCEGSFKTRANLLNHQLTHTGEKKYFCNLCGQQFGHKTSLNLHYRWHTGDKPYSCEFCSKRFSQNGNLQEHLRIHTGVKPFTCESCGRCFTTSSQYKLHVKRHTGERPWQCEFCHKSFLHKDTWKCHVRRHRGERPYECTCCGRGFTEQWALKKHTRLHTGEKPYICDVCGKSFADCSNLTKHRRVHKESATNNAGLPMENAVLQILQTQLPDGTEAHVEAMDKGDANDRVQHVIYVTYQDPNDPSEAKTLHLVDDGGATQDGEGLLSDAGIQGEAAEGALALAPLLGEETPFQLMDEEGNPLQISSTDGEHIQIMMPDGRTIEVTAQGQTVPLNITDADVNHQDDSKIFVQPGLTEDTASVLSVAPDQQVNLSSLEADNTNADESEAVEFTTRDGQHVRVVTPYKLDGLQFLAEFGNIG